MDNEMEKLIEAIKEVSNVVNTIKAEQLRRVNRPEVLYAIENINTGKITFNARGGAYQDKEAAYKKMCRMGQDDHRIVKYRLEK